MVDAKPEALSDEDAGGLYGLLDSGKPVGHGIACLSRANFLVSWACSRRVAVSCAGEVRSLWDKKREKADVGRQTFAMLFYGTIALLL